MQFHDSRGWNTGGNIQGSDRNTGVLGNHTGHLHPRRGSNVGSSEPREQVTAIILEGFRTGRSLCHHRSWKPAAPLLRNRYLKRPRYEVVWLSRCQHHPEICTRVCTSLWTLDWSTRSTSPDHATDMSVSSILLFCTSLEHIPPSWLPGICIMYLGSQALISLTASALASAESHSWSHIIWFSQGRCHRFLV